MIWVIFNMFWGRLLVITLSSKDVSWRVDVMGIHIRTRTTLYSFFRFFDDISSSWNMYLDDSFVITLSSKHLVGRGNVAKRCIKTRSTIQRTRWYLPVLKYVLRTIPSRLRFPWKILQDEQMSLKDVSRREVHFKRIW